MAEMMQIMDPNVLINVGAFMLVVWLVRHTFTHTIPRLAKDFRESIDTQREEFLEELRAQRGDYKEESRLQRERLDKMVDAVGDLSENVKSCKDRLR